MTAPLPPLAEASLRGFSAIVLGYAGTSAAVAGIARLLHLLGAPRSEAVGWPLLAGFLIWAGLALYSLCARRLGAALLAPVLITAAGGALLLATGAPA